MRDGFRALKRAVERAAPAAVEHAAAIVAARVRAEAPRLTGDLAASAEVVPGRDAPGLAAAAVEVSGGHDPREFVGSIEFGDRDQVANPFIRRAVAATRARAAGSIGHDVAAAVAKHRAP